MSMNLISKKSITIRSSAQVVWNALTDPSVIKEWLFGTTTVTDWKVGSPVKFIGEWQGKTYEDKGVVLNNIPDKQLRYTYWSSMSGLKDSPENYAHVTYDIAEDGDEVMLTITQDNISNEDSRKHSEENWEKVLEKIKEITEKG